MSIPPLSLFHDPRSRFIPPLPYRMEESYIIDYDQHYDDYYDRPMDRQQHIPIPRKYQDREYVSPFQAYASYEHTPPHLEQRVKIQTTDYVPIIDIPLAPPPNNPPFSECGLPNGYAKLDRQRYYQAQMNEALQQQLNYGMKSKETRSKQEIDQFYKNLKITYNSDGLISIDNIQDMPEKKIQQNDKVPLLSNQSYRRTPSYQPQPNTIFQQFKQDHIPTQPSSREIPLQAQPQQQSQQQFYTPPQQSQQQLQQQQQQPLTKHYPSSRQLPPAFFIPQQDQPQQSFHQPQQHIEPANSEIVNHNDDDQNSNESVVQAHPNMQLSSLQNPM